MKNFINFHPYLSCAGVAVASNILGGLTCSLSYLGFDYQTIISVTVKGFLMSTLPAIAAATIDQFGHQNLFDNNKPLEYRLTAVEAGIGNIVANNGLDDLKAMNRSSESVSAKSLFISAIAQSIVFKYILDISQQEQISEPDGIQDNPLGLQQIEGFTTNLESSI